MKIIYTDVSTSLLEQGKEYKVFSVLENGIQIYIPTGFVGLTYDRFEIIKEKNEIYYY